jgi:hypothetical protein
MKDTSGWLEGFAKAAERNRQDALDEGLTDVKRAARGRQVSGTLKRRKLKASQVMTFSPSPRRRTIAADLPPLQNYYQED